MILLIPALFAAQAESRIIESVTIAEAECYTMEQQGDQVVSTRVPGLRIIERTAAEGPFVLDIPRVAALYCPRSSLIPAPNDWKVLMAGYPLYIHETDRARGTPRLGVLEVSGGQVRYRMMTGEMTQEEALRLRMRLNQLQEAGRQ